MMHTPRNKITDYQPEKGNLLGNLRNHKNEQNMSLNLRLSLNSEIISLSHLNSTRYQNNKLNQTYVTCTCLW